MLARSILRSSALARQHYRPFASAANKATSSPQGTRGGTVPPQGEPPGNSNNQNTLLYGAAAVGVAGLGYFYLASGKPAEARAAKDAKK